MANESKPQMLFNTDSIENVNIFLGGTCCADEGGWDWRRQVIAHFPDTFSYYDPFIRSWEYPDVEWDDSYIEMENLAKKNCLIAIYVLTPEMRGCYSIAEITAHLCSSEYVAKGDSVMIVIDDMDPTSNLHFTHEMKRSLDACVKLWKGQFGASIMTFSELIEELDRICNMWD